MMVPSSHLQMGHRSTETSPAVVQWSGLNAMTCTSQCFCFVTTAQWHASWISPGQEEMRAAQYRAAAGTVKAKLCMPD